MTPTLTIGITTKNRPDALAGCLASLDLLQGLDFDVLVFDDGSAPPAEAVPPPASARVRVIRDDTSPGYIVGRNRMVREASAPAVLLLDDDTKVLSPGSVERALSILAANPEVAAIAFAQADPDGRPWPAPMQPAPVDYACLVPSFIGFAHLLRRDVFLELGGYRESFIYYGEEKEFCLRLLHAGYKTVYLPDALIAHIPAPGSRSRTRYLRFVVRNDCLNALYNDPLSRVVWMLPARYLMYFRMRRGWGIRDPWGWAWIARELAGPLVRSVGRRRPVSRATIGAWRSLKKTPVPYG